MDRLFAFVLEWLGVSPEVIIGFFIFHELLPWLVLIAGAAACVYFGYKVVKMRTWAVVLLIPLMSGCTLFSRVEDFASKDIARALEIAVKYKDAEGEKCARYLQEIIDGEGILGEDTAGLFSLVEKARVIRIQQPAARQRFTAECGSVALDIMIEIGRRARR